MDAKSWGVGARSGGVDARSWVMHARGRGVGARSRGVGATGRSRHGSAMWTGPPLRDGARVVDGGLGEVTRATTVVADGRVVARTVVVVTIFVVGTGGFVATATGAGSAGASS